LQSRTSYEDEIVDLVVQDKQTWTLPSYEISVPPFTSAKVFGVTWNEVVVLPYQPTPSNKSSSYIRKSHTSIQYSFCLWIKWFNISIKQLSTLQSGSLLTRKLVKLIMMLIYIRILMSTIAPKLSEFAMNTYSFPCNRVNKRRNVNAKTLDEQCELRIHLRLTQTCESSKSSFPLFISDGKISPWPGGYLNIF